MLFERPQNIALIILLLTSQLTCIAQNFITNPGFEGPDGIEVVPEDWFTGCGVMNTPDTQPGWWNVENKPQEGKAYIDLLYKDDGTTESVYQKLAQPIPAGSCMLIEIYLAQACQDSVSGLFPYDLNHPGDFIIRGSESYGCNNGQQLAFFEQVNNCKWRKFVAVFQAHETINYIYLEFYRGSSPHNNGSILIDNFYLNYLEPFETEILSFGYGETTIIQASVEGSNFNWQIDDIYLENDSSFQIITMNQNTNIAFTYWSEDSCLISESYLLYVKPAIPNIFTPNNKDGINDVFFIKGLIETTSLFIVNRWGETVYENSNYQNDWSPIGLEDGVYFYSLRLHETNRIFDGFVTLL